MSRELMNLSRPSRLDILRDRSRMLAEARNFFNQRNILEVDCPLITEAASIDAHIDLITVQQLTGPRYLHSSPEYAMKRLIVEGIGDIYQLGHVFRDGEQSDKHNPEFTMAEWYRMGISFDAMIAETVDFIRIFLGPLSSHTISYRDLFLKYTNLDYSKATEEELFRYLSDREIVPYKNIELEGRDALLNLILGTLIEPQLGQNELCVLAYYPSSQAALAKTTYLEGDLVAERFEIYYQGIELCNGYHELGNSAEQRERFIESNAHRVKLGKIQLPIDDRFLQALDEGLPDCCGVAVGFDRLMMMRHHQKISGVIPFSWDSI